MDLYDAPEAVESKALEAHAMWWRYFQAFDQIIQPAHRGYSAWTPLYSQTPYYMLQCDFAYMISTPMFDRFVKPELQATCRRLANPFYHLDGRGQLAPPGFAAAGDCGVEGHSVGSGGRPARDHQVAGGLPQDPAGRQNASSSSLDRMQWDGGAWKRWPINLEAPKAS